MPKLYFSNEHQEVEASSDVDLRRVAIENGVELYPGVQKFLNCRGRGHCGTCKVRVRNQAALSVKTGAETSKIPQTDPTVRLACQTFAFEDCEVQTFPRVRQSWMDHACYQHLIQE